MTRPLPLLLCLLACLCGAGVAPSTTAPTTLPATRAVADAVRPFTVYDLTWGGGPVPGAKPALWAHVSVYSPFEPATPDTVRAFGEALERGDSDWQAWSWTVDLRGTRLVVFDTEGRGTQLEQLALLRAFKDACPGAKVAWIGGASLTDTLEQVNAYFGPAGAEREQARKLVADRLAVPGVRECGQLTDVLVVNGYMLGPATVDRDLAAIRAGVRLYRERWPGKPVVVLAWGSFHTSWSPPHSVLPSAVMTRYAGTLRGCGADGTLVWGEREDNEALFAALAPRP